jgi:hypothetical protein
MRSLKLADIAWPPNEGMKQTRLRTAPVGQAEVPSSARWPQEPRTASQPIPGVRRTILE